MVCDSNTNMTTLDFLVPRPRVSVCHAWWAKMVKFVGRNAVVEGKVCGGLWWVVGRDRRRRISMGRARRMVKDFTMS
ncbi:hypothetical protein Hanom_Chr14g01324681 [Helianthus anomalus]